MTEVSGLTDEEAYFQDDFDADFNDDRVNELTAGMVNRFASTFSSDSNEQFLDASSSNLLISLSSDKSETSNSIQSIQSSYIQNLRRKRQKPPVLQITLPPLSEEQKKIVTSVTSGSNLIIDSVAGSGKTTTILGISKSVLETYPDSYLLILTYNSRLKDETRRKCGGLGLTHVETHSYHAFCHKFYDAGIKDDQGIINLIKHNMKPMTKENQALIKFNTIIIDECQDMSLLYHYLVKKIITDLCHPNVQIIVLGDRYQMIYDFMGCDQRYLTYACYLYNTHRVWENYRLSVSYRLTNEIANFVNYVMLGCPPENPQTQRINTVRAGLKVQYLVANPFSVPISIIENLLINPKKEKQNNQGDDVTSSEAEAVEKVSDLTKRYKPDDIFILAPSVKAKGTGMNTEKPIVRFANRLSRKGIPVYHPSSDDETPSEEALKGKVGVCTFHSVKGLERKVTIIFGFDNSYFAFFKKDQNPLVCTNDLYVATTRSSELLIVIQGDDTLPLPFLKLDLINKYCDLYGQMKEIKTFDSSKARTINVTDLTAHLPSTVLHHALSLVKFHVVSNPRDEINLGSVTDSSHTEIKEYVSDINGLIVPSIYEMKMTGTSTIITFIKQHFLKEGLIDEDGPNIIVNDKSSRLLNQREQARICQLLTKKDLSLTDISYLTVAYDALRTGYIVRLNQISNFSWLEQRQNEVRKCSEILEIEINKSGIKEAKEVLFETDITVPMTVCGSDFVIRGRMDIITNDHIWEIKCTKSLRPEHLIQLAVYAYMISLKDRSNWFNYRYQLLNVLTGECVILDPSSNLYSLVYMLIYEKCIRKYTPKTDQQFISDCYMCY